MSAAYRQVLSLLDRAASPLQRAEWPSAKAAGVELFVKRDDLLDPQISGNKWRKLMLQIAWELRQGATHFATVGGVHSNHVPAFAALLRRLSHSHIQNLLFKASHTGSNLDSKHILNIGTSPAETTKLSSFAFVRGQIPSALSPSLAFAKTCGLELYTATRLQVRNWRTQPPSREELQGATWIPEGGTTKLGLLGMAQCYREIKQQLGQTPDAIIVAAGSGGSAAGLARKASCPIHAMDVVGDKGLPTRMTQLLSPRAFDRINFHQAKLKGFASGEKEVLQTMQDFKAATGIQLEPIYTAKALLKLDQLLQQGEFRAGSKIVFVHTGGLQGLEPWVKRYWP